MAQALLVDQDIEAGRALLKALDEAGYRVTAALWTQREEDGEYRLVLASPFVEQTGKAAAYARIAEVLNRQGLEDRLPLRRIEVVEPDEPLITALRRVVPTKPADIGHFRFTDCNVFGTFIPDALVYRCTSTVNGKKRQAKRKNRKRGLSGVG